MHIYIYEYLLNICVFYLKRLKLYVLLLIKIEVWSGKSSWKAAMQLQNECEIAHENEFILNKVLQVLNVLDCVCKTPVFFADHPESSSVWFIKIRLCTIISLLSVIL